MTTRRAALVLLATLGALGCSHHEWPRGSTTATLFGPDARLDGWTTSVVEGIHVHSARPEEPCEAAGLGEVAAKIGEALQDSEERKDAVRGLGKGMGTFMEAMLAQNNGPAHGGKDRTVVALRRSDGDESIVVDLPRLKADETEHTFRAGELKAVYEHPVKTASAGLARGWVRALRTGSGGHGVRPFPRLHPAAPRRVRVDAGRDARRVAPAIRLVSPPPLHI
jgi:hypothetical protein